MGFNKRYFILEKTLKALKKKDLKSYFGKSDLLVFEDSVSSFIYTLFSQGKTEQEIINILNINSEELSNEMYQSNQSN